MTSSSKRLRWRLGVLAALAIALISLYPQFHLWRATGAHSPYASIAYDETAYSAYLNSLIQGRPRRNNPYTGQMDSQGSPQPETIFSIQFVPPYLLAWPARLFGLSASTTFLLLAPIAAFASTVALFWLLGSITNDDYVASTGTIFVLCMGSLASSFDAWLAIVHLHQPFTLLQSFYFLRRYEPAVPYPFFIAFCILVLGAFTSTGRRGVVWRAVAAGLIFAILVFSYFFLWTAALAWLACVAGLWILARRDDRQRVLLVLAIIAAFAFLALAPYSLLVSRTAAATNQVQGLVYTRTPDLFRMPELLGALVLAGLIGAAWKGILKWRESGWLFAASYALVPFVCFNQQILTARTLQPIHYEWSITPHLVLASVIVVATLLWQAQKGAGVRMPRALLLTIALASLCWAVVDVYANSRSTLPASRLRVQEQFLASRLTELARGVSQEQLTSQVVLFTPSLLLVHAESLPTYAPQPVLMAPEMFLFASDWSDYKERLYKNFYYGGFDRNKMEAFAHQRIDELRLVFSKYEPSLLSGDNFTDRLVADYLSYVASFNRERAAQPRLAYLVTSVNDDSDLTNLDRWYERDTGERLGDLVLYQLKFRQQ